MMEIEKLEKRLDKRFEERDKEATRQGYLAENEKEIQDGLKMRISDFYCKRCKCDYLDYKSTGVVESDWSNEDNCVAYWNSRHTKCGTWNRRLITNKRNDPYWVKSPKMKRDVGNYYRDMIQPNQSGFEMLYGKKINYGN